MMMINLSVAALLIGSGAALAQGTQQSAVPSNGGYSRVEPIGRSGNPVGTPHSNMYANPIDRPIPPAASNHVIVVPQRRR